MNSKISRSYIFILLALVVGVVSGWLHQEVIFKTAETLSTLFMNFLQLIATPIVFLSILSTLFGMSGFKEMKIIGKKVFLYTILTTLVAAMVALVLFLVIHPVKPGPDIQSVYAAQEGSYLSFLINIVPSNFVGAFLENNVMGITFLAFLLGYAGLKLPKENKEVLNSLFSSLFKLILKIAGFVIYIMPIGIWAFVTLLVRDMNNNSEQFNYLILYLVTVLGANLVQGLIVLPVLLKLKGLAPLQIARGASQALILAFFSKSSNAALPVSLQCAEKKLGIKTKIANFSLPLCTVINMNGCAAFILTTVLFVSSMNGVHFSPVELSMWVVLATLAAIGNAGVPMGCYFLSSAFLIAMGVPLTILGAILPFYAFLDMVETALNVWSDLAVTAMINKDLKEDTLLA